MLLLILAFLCGDLFLQQFSHLPSNAACFALMSIGLIGSVLSCKHIFNCKVIVAFIFGFVWSAWYAASLLAWSLPHALEGQALLVTGNVVSLPLTDRFQTKFEFELQSLQYQHRFFSPHARIRLAWRGQAPQIHVGDHWQLLVKLKRIHSTLNPGSFDMEAWALQKGLRATGYVLPGNANQLLFNQSFHHPIDTIRQHLLLKMNELLPHSATAPWLIALTLGERADIAPQDWQVLRKTGTNHLMAIAGLHIGMMSGFIHLIVTRWWRRSSRLTLALPVPFAGACAAWIAALSYSALAGFSLPTQRACIMLTVFVLVLLCRRKINPWNAWSLALLIVLLFNPLSVLTDSFWLSFGTIALIIYGMRGRLAPTGYWWKWGRVQWVIGVGLVPISLMLFQQCSVISFAANSIAIPWLGFFILPFCLLSMLFIFIFPLLSKWCLLFADHSLAALWWILTWLSHLDFAAWSLAIPNISILFLTTIGFLVLLLPAGVSIRPLGFVYLLPLLLWIPHRPAQADVWMTLLDVGQGLSVVIQTATHTLVYDAGPRMGANLDMGENVVLPYLHTIGVKQLDMLVVSHGDNDHIGGAQAVLHGLPVNQIKTSVPNKILTSKTDYCLAGESWVWDQVHFSFLYPDKNALNLGNDSSCVLLIDNGEQRILLPGDIEKSAELTLLAQAFNQLSATILVAPHHGSKTSGMKPFVSAVHPQYVLYATGYRNRYHFPHESVVNEYRQLGSVQLNTVDTGAMEFRLEKGMVLETPTLYRMKKLYYWED